jgi:hypothetical protein
MGQVEQALDNVFRVMVVRRAVTGHSRATRLT